VNNFSPTPTNFTPDPNAPKYSATKAPYRLLGGSVVPVDPNLKGQYLDEFLLGYDYEIAQNLAIGIKGSYRKLDSVIEDMLVPASGDYFVANPGTGLGAEGGTINGDTVPVPRPTRNYTAMELHAQKRFSNNYQFFASYVVTPEGQLRQVPQVTPPASSTRTSTRHMTTPTSRSTTPAAACSARTARISSSSTARTSSRTARRTASSSASPPTTTAERR
jgi:hypothetical protein